MQPLLLALVVWLAAGVGSASAGVQDAAKDEGEPDMRVDASRLTLPDEGRCRDREHHGQEPLGEE